MVDFQCKPHYSYEDFLEVMRLLRTPGGCPWDREQTHGSIRRNFLEETYEVLDALDRDDPRDMCEELGDVMMQVAFHAQIEAERGNFTMDDVVACPFSLRLRASQFTSTCSEVSASTVPNTWGWR